MSLLALRTNVVNKDGVIGNPAELTRWYADIDWIPLVEALQEATAGINPEFVSIGGSAFVDDGRNVTAKDYYADPAAAMSAPGDEIGPALELNPTYTSTTGFASTLNYSALKVDVTEVQAGILGIGGNRWPLWFGVNGVQTGGFGAAGLNAGPRMLVGDLSSGFGFVVFGDESIAGPWMTIQDTTFGNVLQYNKDGTLALVSATAQAAISIDGNQVLGPRGAAVAKPSGGVTQDAEARAAIDLIIDRLASAVGHGLWT